MNEKEILEFWKKKKIYEKSKKKNSKGKKFYMMDGPPYATGNIHMGTALNKILKDVTMRSQRLQGKNVFDRPGYDTHGVPIEIQIEKEIGSKSKKDIEKYGVKKFIEKCKKFATQYIGVMNSEFENLGVWMDFSNPYLTLDKEYIEKIWETFKYADKKNLLYLGKYPVHVCPRCETVVAFNEIEYGKQEDTSIFVKFRLKNEKNTYLIIWTTTPWTLPGNTGVMANPNFVYQKIKLSNGEHWIMAKKLIPEIMGKLEIGYTPEKEFLGKEMNEWQYEMPLEKYINIKLKKLRKVVLSSRYVNLEEGTGLVHSAPGHGKEDFEVGKKTGLDIVSPVDIKGILTKEAGKYAGGKAREIDKEIINDLKKENMLVYEMKYTHDYPLCWRCHTPLLMISIPQWFLKISEIQKKILKENEKINWIPNYMKLRMKAWLEGISDWPVSRDRYWGTPLPIWVCNKCNKKIVIGSVKELEKLSGQKVKGIHKPEIDEIKIKCGCGGGMSRVNGVLDVWFDSGVSSWAALETQDKIKKYWPADLNIEGKDQFRGWWNSQLILSEIRFNKKPMESISVHGMVLDLGKKKMSKSKGNAIAPNEVIEKYSRDLLRYALTKTSKGEDFSFDEKELKENKVLRMLENIKNFIFQIKESKEKIKIEDKWIISKFNSFLKETKESYNKFKFPEAVQRLEEFLIETLSKKYIKLIRDRAGEVKENLEKIYLGTLKLFAPIIPFYTEKIWQEFLEKKKVKEDSIHLSKWLEPDEKKINKKLELKFEIALEVIEKGLAERDKEKIGLKWPLAKAIIYSKEHQALKELEEIIKKQLNVKEIELKASHKAEELKVKLDTKMTPELEAEGYARNLIRSIQAFRKKLGLKPENVIKTLIITNEKTKKILEKNKDIVADKTNSKELNVITESKETFKNKADFKIKDKKGEIVIIKK